MKAKKVIISMILSLSILFSGVPLSVHGEESTNMQETEEIAEPVSDVNDDNGSGSLAPDDTEEPVADDTEKPIADDTEKPAPDDTEEPVADENENNDIVVDCTEEMLPEDFGEMLLDDVRDTSDQNPSVIADSELTLSVEYPVDIKCGQQVTFKMSATGGSGNYKYRIGGLMVYDGSELVSVYDISYGSNGSYKESNEFTFTFYASGTYYLRFSVIDMATYDTVNTGLYDYQIVIQDANYPSVEQIVDTVAAQCQIECSTDFEKALWLHDWILDHADYDYSYSYCSAEGVLARGKGTCEAYHRAYVMLLNKVGIQTGRITGNGHVWTAVKMDGEWYQVDSTWDDMGVDYKDTYYEHMYFGLTDYIIGLVHTDHKAAVSGYESSSLENNYFIKTGEIAQWSDPFVDIIRQKIAGGETEFILPVTDSMPDSYKNVIYNLVAYQLSKRDWDNTELSVSYADNQLTCKTKSKEEISIQGINIQNTDNGKGTFEVVVKGVYAPSGISEVKVSVWSGNNQGNIHRYTAVKQRDGSYIAHVDIKNHKYEYGVYTAQVYVTAGNGVCELVGETQTTVVQPQTSLKLLLSGDETVCNITAENVGALGGKVSFAVWSEAGGQDDLQWYDGDNIASGTWQKYVPIVLHKNGGRYQVHAYSVDQSGKYTLLATNTFTVSDIKVQKIAAQNVNTGAGTFDVVVSGITSVSGVSTVQVPVWSGNSQDNIYWYTATKQRNGSYIAHVDIENHKYDYGVYTAHVYVTGGNGVYEFVGETKTTMEQPRTDLKALLSGDETVCNVTAENVGVPGGLQKVSFAVWSEVDGQDDLVWYDADNISNGIWQKYVPVSMHKSVGTYQVHAYGINKSGEYILLARDTFTVSGVKVNGIAVQNVNPGAGTFDVVVSGITSVSGVSTVRVPVWSENGQGNIYWYTAEKQKDGSYIAHVDIKNHKYAYGVYTIHVYMTAGNGVTEFAGRSKATMNQPQTKLQILLSGDETVCNITAKDVGVPGGVRKVSFAVWSDAGGQDDLIWYDGDNISNGVWQKYVPIALHKSGGRYQVHAYGIDQKGEYILLARDTFVISDVKVQKIAVKNVNYGTGTFDVVVSGITSVSGVSTVQVPVWSGNSQDNIYWYTATKQRDGSYRAHVDIKNHQYDYGVYVAHVYVTAGNGVYEFVGETKATVNQPKTKLTVLLSGDETVCNITAQNVGVSGGVQKVTFAVWSEVNGQDDLVWYDGDNTSSGTWQKYVPISMHKSAGKYQVHTYGINRAGEYILLATDTFTVKISTR